MTTSAVDSLPESTRTPRSLHSLCKSLSTLQKPSQLSQDDISYLAGVMCSPAGVFHSQIHPHIQVIVPISYVAILHKLHTAFGGEVITGPDDRFIYTLSDISTLVFALSSVAFQRYLSRKRRRDAAIFLKTVLSILH